MQIIIARILNRLMAFIGLFIALSACALFWGIREYPDYRFYLIAGFIIVTSILSFFFKWLEGGWDKRVITKMAGTGKIALMNIEGGKRYLPLRDTNFIRYWIYEFEGILYDRDHKPFKKTFYEKMSYATETVPPGTVYVTWDETKPAQIFIIPNALIGSLPDLMPLVSSYEKDESITIKYMDVYYRRGICFRSFRETLAAYKADGKKGTSKTSK